MKRALYQGIVTVVVFSICMVLNSGIVAAEPPASVAAVPELSGAGSEQPLATSPSPVELPSAPVIITGYQITDASLGFLQVYNKSSTLVSLEGWRLSVVANTPEGETIIPVTLSGRLLPGKYAVVAQAGRVTKSDTEFAALPKVPEATVNTLELSLPGVYRGETVNAQTVSGRWMTLSKSSAGNYTTTSKFTPAAVDALLYGGGLYTYPEETPLRIVEIAANPKDCGPLEKAAECVSFIKIFNTSTQVTDVSPYRLRLGYANQPSGIANTIDLNGGIEPGGYKTIQVRDDGDPLKISASTGNVWLEDDLALKTYTESAVSYHDLGIVAHQGQSWALDSDSGEWKWAIPTMDGSNNFAVPAPIATTSLATSPVSATTPGASLSPCKPGQYRSPETNRCRAVASESTVMTPCSDGQVRNLETNRCRTIATAASTLTPCAANQERNPATNRCRSLAAADTSTTELKPCSANQERNPETNRCRTVAATAMPEAAFKAEPVPDSSATFTGWWTLGGITVLGAGYGAWEWRREMWSLLQRTQRFLTGSR